jgi:uncharacterized protein (TIGR03067 family)
MQLLLNECTCTGGFPARAWLAFALIIAQVTGTSVCSAATAAIADSKAIQGECVELIEEGKTYTAPPTIVWVFADDRVTLLAEGRKQHTGTFKLEPSATPPSIDMKLKGESADNSDADIVGIYKLEKDTLTICVGVEGAKNKRPAAFTYTKESPTASQVLGRVK